jgi:hypothetical protein
LSAGSASRMTAARLPSCSTMILISCAVIRRSAEVLDRSIASARRRSALAEIYKGLSLTLTYQPTSGTIHAKAQISPETHGVMVGVRGGSAPLSQCVLTGEFALAGAR